MKFSASLKNGILLQKLFCAFEKITKKITLRITPLHLTFIHQEGSFQSWSQIDTELIFQNVIFSVTSMDAIHIQIEVDSFSKVLKGLFAPEANSSLSSSSSFVATSIKLSRIQTDSTSSSTPVLIISGTDAQGSVKVVHELSVTILTQLQASCINEPELPTPDVQIVLPNNLRALKVACDAIKKKISKSSDSMIKVKANCKGSFEISDSACYIRWGKLVNPPIAASSANQTRDNLATPPACNQQASEEGSFSVNVDIKDLCRTMQALHLNPSHAIACLLDKQCLLIYFFLQSNSTCNMSFLMVNKSID